MRIRNRIVEFIANGSLPNGLGGHASGTVGGLNTRRFHGWLIAALPAPHGRTMMVNSLRERFYIGEKQFVLECDDFGQGEDDTPGPEHNPAATETERISAHLKEFWLECGLPATCRRDSVPKSRNITWMMWYSKCAPV